MGQQKRNIPTFLLMCTAVSLAADMMRAALGAEMDSQGQMAGGDKMAVQESKAADILTEPQANLQESKSMSSVQKRKLRRRKPKMASVPAGSQAVIAVQEPAQPAVRAIAQETKEAGAPDGTLEKKGAGVQSLTQEAREAGVLDRPQEAEGEEVVAAQRPQTTDQDSVKTDIFALAKPGKAQKKWAIAPIKWTVRVSDTLSWSRSSNNLKLLAGPPTSFGNTKVAQLDMKTYILHPNIASVNGGIGVINSKDSTGGISNGSNNSLIGRGGLQLLRSSNTPFKVSFSVNDSRADSALNTSIVKSNQLALEQSYFPRGSTSRYVGRYTTNNTKSNYGDYSVDSLWEGEYMTQLGSRNDQPFQARATRNAARNTLHGILDKVISSNIITASHTYLPPESLLTLRTDGSFTEVAQGQDQSYLTRILLATTAADWQPEEEELPVFVNGKVNLMVSSSKTPGGSSISKSVGSNVGATYVASSSLVYDARMGLTHAGSRWYMNEGAGATYRSLQTVFPNNSIYSWNANGRVSNNTGGTPQISGFAGHNLRGPYALTLISKKVFLDYAIDQSLSASFSQRNGKSATIINGGRLIWREQLGDVLSGGVTASATDKRTFGKNPSHSQVFTIGTLASANKRLGYSGYGVTADLQMASTRNTNGKLTTTVIGNAVYIYSKMKLFGVRGLNYVVNLRADAPLYDSALQNVQNDPNAPKHSRVNYGLGQDVSYRIGMNQVLLSSRLDKRDGLNSASLFLYFRAWRAIGN